MTKIVADLNIPYVEEAFRELGEVTSLPTPEIGAATVREAEVLVIRNETPVTEELLRGSRVRFVASATAGTDHVDFPYLQAQGIGFANSPGCNANSVKEYVVAALLAFAAREGVTLSGRTLGVVGVGQIGSRVVKAGEALGMRVLENDPPLARETGDPRFVALDEVLEADVITLHTPLTQTGLDATYHLFDHDRIARMKTGAIFLNTARGAVVDTEALKQALRQGRVAAALIDVWENEPAIDTELLAQAALGTAHVAGYSMEGKLAAVKLVRDAVCSHLGHATSWDPAQHLGTPEGREIELQRHDPKRERALHEIVRRVYDVEEDDARLRKMMSLKPEQRAAYYTSLRTGYPSRREFSSYRIQLRPEQGNLKPTLSALGFDCALTGPVTPRKNTNVAAGNQ
jgi:erythronate-4-phosphate dehydrogenase